MTRPPWRPRKPETLASGSKAEDYRYSRNARASCPCTAAARACGRPGSRGLQQLPLTSHAVSAHGERGASGAAADQRYPIGCAAAPAGAGHEGERRLTLRGRSPTIRGPGLEAAAQRRPISPRHRSARRKATAALPRRRDSSGIVLAECPGPSALAQRPARLASGQVGRTAQHPELLGSALPPTVSRACSRARVGRSSCYCTVPAGP